MKIEAYKHARTYMHQEVGLDLQMDFSSFDCSISFQINRFTLSLSISSSLFFLLLTRTILLQAFCRSYYFAALYGMSIVCDDDSFGTYLESDPNEIK